MTLPGASPLERSSSHRLTDFVAFTRDQWAAFGRRVDAKMSGSDVEGLAATGEPVSLEEVVDVYVPLSQLLQLLAEAKRELHERMAGFLAEDRAPVPFVVGIAGSVAVGKSTTARLLQALLAQSPGYPTVELLTTDGFLHPNADLEAQGLMERKGFPESYDQHRLVTSLAAIRAGEEVAVPVYSHVSYDIVPAEFQVIRRPAMVIVEGLNVLQVNTKGAAPEQVVVSDFFDFSIYVDAAEEDIARWFRTRLLTLRRTVLRQPEAFFHRLASLSEDEVSLVAEKIWSEINLVNLRENIAPTRSRAHLVLEKGSDHRVQRVLLRRP